MAGEVTAEGTLEIFSQEGGYACDGIVVDGVDLGKSLRQATGIDGEGVILRGARVVVTWDEAEPGSWGFFKQMEHARE